MNYKLIAIDMDGTLLNNEEKKYPKGIRKLYTGL